MRSAAFAEWLLSLVAPPDRAASTTGDLLEEAPARGSLWFWSCVLRTACTHVWRDLSASPWRMVRLAFWGWLANIVLGLLFVAFAGGIWGLVLAIPGLASMLDGYSRSIISSGMDFLIWSLKIVLATAVPLLTGLLLARHSGGREMGAVLSLVALSAIARLLQADAHTDLTIPLREHVFFQFCAFTAGAILFRIRANKEVRHA